MKKPLKKGIKVIKREVRQYKTSDNKTHTNAIMANRHQATLTRSQAIQKVLIDQGLTFPTSRWTLSTVRLAEALQDSSFLKAVASAGRVKRKKRAAAA